MSMNVNKDNVFNGPVLAQPEAGFDQCVHRTKVWMGSVVAMDLACSLEKGHDDPNEPELYQPTIDEDGNDVLYHEAYDDEGNMLCSWQKDIEFHAQFS